MAKRTFLAVVAVVAFVLPSGQMCQLNVPPSGPDNAIPALLSVNAGSDQTITLLTTTTLTGSASGGIPPYSFEWSVADGPDQTITDANIATATVTGINAGTTTFQFTVTDSAGATLGAVVKVTVTAKTPDEACIVTPIGLIQQRWDELGGAAGPLGCATSPELDVPGRNGKRQTFEHGEVVWSPDQGPSMVVAAYQQDDNIIVNWGDASQDYDKFVVSWDRDGANVGQADASTYVEPRNGFFAIRAAASITVPNVKHAVTESPLLPGLYSIVVQGCISPGGLVTACPLGWTIPVNVRYETPPLADAAIKPCLGQPGWDPSFVPYGLIGERWAQLGGADGPLGCPTEPEHDVEGRNGRAQSFEHGQVIFSPDQGGTMTVAAYQDGGQLVAVWGSTAPNAYTSFKVSWDRADGTNLGEAHTGSGTSGSWSTPVGAGDYRVRIAGCIDLPVGGPVCDQEGTIPADVRVAFPPPDPNAPDPNNDCAIQPIGLIRDRWLALGGKNGRLGCPTGPEETFDDPFRKAMAFEHGAIVWAPSQGDKMTLAIFQDGDNVVVAWADMGNSYDYFNVRLDYELRNVGQVKVDQSGTSGEWRFANGRREDDTDTVIVDEGEGLYSAVVQGCRLVGGIVPVCSPFSPPAFLYQRQNGQIDLSSVPTPTSVEDCFRDKDTRALKAAQAWSDAKSLSGQWGDDGVTTAIALLHLVQDDVLHGKSPSDRRRPRSRFSVLTEINDAIRDQTISADSGTPLPQPCERSGDYDVVLKGYIPIIYRYARYLAPDVQYRLLHLLNKAGPHDPGDDAHSCVAVSIPETENHRLMIESSRYLTNQLLFKRTNDPRFDNSRNATLWPLIGTIAPMDQYILQFLQDFLKNDFLEYNSRPYERYSWAAIQNLYDYAENPKVKTAARMVLDYLSAKVAVSASDGRRNPPYRRRASHNHLDLFHQESDPLKNLFFIYTAPTSVMKDFYPPDTVKFPATSEMVLAAATTYQPPDLVLNLMVNPDARLFYQRFAYRGAAEVYSGGRDFLISGGGIPTGYAYSVTFLGLGDKEDLGVAEPTALMPTGQFTSIDQMIHFAPAFGAVQLILPGAGLCVAPNFACGLAPFIPARYTDNAGCSISNPPWTFIDFSSDGCKDDPGGVHSGFGFYAAVYNAGGDFGFLEVVPKNRLTLFVPKGGGLRPMTLQEFANATMNRNAGRTYSATSENVYTASWGTDIHFDIRRPNPIVSTGLDMDADNPSLADWPLASGIITSDGHSGLITIANQLTGEQLILDFRDVNNPVRTPP